MAEKTIKISESNWLRLSREKLESGFKTLDSVISDLFKKEVNKSGKKYKK